MKRLVGGEYLLDLSSIELEKSEDGSTKTNITDSDVLEQLTNLKKYISNPEMAKPVWVKLKNGENDELVIARGTFAVVDTGEFEICVQLDGYKLVIFIEFTQVLNSDDEPLDDWYIDTNDAKYLFTLDAQALAGQLTDFTGDVGITGDVDITGDIAVTGKVNGKIAYEDIEDAQGHKRFIDGDIEIETVSGITKSYGKWSLSGSHLLIVLCLDLADETIFSYQRIAYVNVPAWVKDKIVPISDTYVDSKVFNAFDSALNSQQINGYLLKVDNNIQIDIGGTTLTADRKVRMAFDLLIDNEQSE